MGSTSSDVTNFMPMGHTWGQSLYDVADFMPMGHT